MPDTEADKQNLRKQGQVELAMTLLKEGAWTEELFDEAVVLIAEGEDMMEELLSLLKQHAEDSATWLWVSEVKGGHSIKTRPDLAEDKRKLISRYRDLGEYLLQCAGDMEAKLSGNSPRGH